jgi:hypothetical protein
MPEFAEPDSSRLADEVLAASNRVSLVDLVEKRLRAGGSSELDVADRSEALVRKVKRRLESRIQDWQLEGRDPLGRLGGPNETIWIPASTNLEHIKVWLEAITSLEGHAFEAFVTFVLRKSGHAAMLIPKMANESGIDLYGRLVPENQVGLLTAIPARFVAQVTLEHIGEDRARIFKNDYIDFVGRRGRAAPLVQDWFWEPRLPFLPVLVGGGGFSSPAMRYAHSFGCLTLEGEDVARGAAPLLDETVRGMPTAAKLTELGTRVERN